MRDIPDILRRASLRYVARVPCEAVTADDFRRVGGTLRDVSDHGFLLQADVSLVPGEEVFLSFRAPRTSLWVAAVAKVVRVARQDGRRGCLAGLSVESMDPVERGILAGAVGRLPPKPRRRQPSRDYAAWVAQVSGAYEVVAGF